MVGDLRRMHHKKDPVAAGEFPQIEPLRLQELGARAFHEREIVGMEHHAARIGVLIVDAKRPGEGLWASAHCPNSARESDRFGAERPRWREAETVATRPRGGRGR